MYKFDEEVYVYFLRVKLLHKVVRSLHGAACSQQVVVQQHDVVLGDGVLMNLDSVGAVLLRVALLYGFAGQLAGLTAQNNAGVELYGQLQRP